jgi:hypothetical protein
LAIITVDNVPRLIGDAIHEDGVTLKDADEIEWSYSPSELDGPKISESRESMDSRKME